MYKMPLITDKTVYQFVTHPIEIWGSNTLLFTKHVFSVIKCNCTYVHLQLSSRKICICFSVYRYKSSKEWGIENWNTSAESNMSSGTIVHEGKTELI